MNHTIAKLRLKKGSNNSKYRKLLSNATIYEIPNDFSNSILYDPATNLSDGEWFEIRTFSKTPFYIGFLSDFDDSISYEQLEEDLIQSIDYICTYQNSNEFYFQNITKTQLLAKKVITIGDIFTYQKSSKHIAIREPADAIYIKDDDKLYFKTLSAITGIFKGIDQLFKEATNEETERFLALNFITLDNDFSATSVKQANRKRIALAAEALNGFSEKDKVAVFNTIKEYCPKLVESDNTFKIKTEDDLTLLLYGLNQRFYTTPDGKEKRIANSIIRYNMS